MAGTETPSPERLRRALREGDSPISLTLVRVVALGAVAFGGPAAATALAARFTERLRGALAGSVVSTPDVAFDVVMLSGPLVATAAVVAVVAGLAQTAGVVTFRKRARISGLGRILDGQRAYAVVRSTITAVCVLGSVGWVLVNAAPDMAASIGRTSSVLISAVVERVVRAALWPLVASALVDVAVRRAAWIERWTLSPHDRKRERRDAEGDPNQKRERRRIHEELLKDAPADDSAR